MEEFLNKKVKVIFNDTGRAIPKKGILISIKDGFIVLESDSIIEAIPINSVIRIEVSKDD